jgi:hypothetical protein
LHSALAAIASYDGKQQPERELWKPNNIASSTSRKARVRITCDRCGKDRMVNESHAAWRDRALRDILKRMRHDGCGGLPGRAELLTGIEGASSRPVRRIMLLGE